MEEEDKLLAGGGSERPLGLSLLQLPQQTRDRGHGDTRGLGHADQLLLHAGNIRKLEKYFAETLKIFAPGWWRSGQLAVHPDPVDAGGGGWLLHRVAGLPVPGQQHDHSAHRPAKPGPGRADR